MQSTNQSIKELTEQVSSHESVESSDNHTESDDDSDEELYPELTEQGGDDCRLIIDELHSRVENRSEEYVYLRSRDLARNLPLNTHQIGTYLSEYVCREPGVEIEKWSQTTYRIEVDEP